jgi:hypothetical protein
MVGCIHIFENLVDLTHSVQFLGVAHVNDSELMSRRLAEDVTKNAFKLLVTVFQLDDKMETRKYEFQGNLIHEGTLDAYTI